MAIVLLNMKRMLLELFYSGEKESENGSNFVTQIFFSQKLLLVDFLFDLILYVHSTIFQLCGTGLPGLNQY